MSRQPTMSQLRRRVKAQLHQYLDTMLRTSVTAPNGETVSLLDDCCMRAVLGYGFSVGISVRHPEEQRRGEPAVQPLLHGPECRDPACQGTCRPLQVVR